MALMSEPVVSRQDDTRKQLGIFTRPAGKSRSAALRFAAQPSPRTPGLRREEVAMLADVGVTWHLASRAGTSIRPAR
jgi:hypothetical protein